MREFRGAYRKFWRRGPESVDDKLGESTALGAIYGSLRGKRRQ